MRICGVAMLCAFAALLLSRWQGEYAPLVRIGGLVLIGTALVQWMKEGAEQTLSLLGGEAILPYATVMLRALGIALITRVCGEVCRECGAGSLSLGVDLAGKLLILLLCIPLIEDVLSLAERILQMGESGGYG